VLELISTDDHIIEHQTVWTDRVPARHRENAPHVATVDGVDAWIYESRIFPMSGMQVVAGKRPEDWSNKTAGYRDMIPGCYDPIARADDLQHDNIVGSLGFPTFPRFAGTRFLDHKDPGLASDCIRAWNDFCIDEWCASVPGLYIPMIIAQLWDPAQAAEEIRRGASKGARAFSLVENPVPLGLPSFFSDYWDPIWEAVAETGLPVLMHVGTSGTMQEPSPEIPHSAGMILCQTNSASAFINIAYSPVLKKFSDIQFVLSEGGIGWIASTIERADNIWEAQRHFEKLSGPPPSELFHSNFYGCFIREHAGIDQLEHIGVERIMWECDYPHAEAPWPRSQEALTPVLGGLESQDVAMVTHENARRLFNWWSRPASAVTDEMPTGDLVA
jgi:predicted TIM-barrel fold metal-dependent hydrolase